MARILFGLAICLLGSAIAATSITGVMQPTAVYAAYECYQPVRMDFDGMIDTRMSDQATTMNGIFVFYQHDRRLIPAEGELTILLNGQPVWTDLKVACPDFRDWLSFSTPRRAIFGWRFGPQIITHPQVTLLEARFRPKRGLSFEMRKELGPR